MAEKRRLVDELILDRQIEEFRENIKGDLRHFIDKARVREVAARIYSKLSDNWGLSKPQSAALIGRSEDDLNCWRNDDARSLNVEDLEKISCLLGIYSWLFTLYSGHAERVHRWLLRENHGERYEGKAPFELLSGASANTFQSARRKVTGTHV